MAEYNSLLQKMAKTTDTDYWNDSCAISELKYAIPNGAVGATTNPVIVLNVLKKEYDLW
ncbi:MAG: transaldolase, partial [Spirochaetes bacterium]